MAVVFEGTWEELKHHEAELSRYSNLTIIANSPIKQKHKFATPEERVAAMDAFRETNRGLPTLPDSAWDRESIYD